MQHATVHNIRVDQRVIPATECTAKQLQHARLRAVERVADARAIPWPALADAWQRDLDAIDAELARRAGVS